MQRSGLRNAQRKAVCRMGMGGVWHEGDVEGMPLVWPCMRGMHRDFGIRQTCTSYETDKSPLSSAVHWGNNTVSLIKKVVGLKCLVQPFHRVIRLFGGVNWQLWVKLGMVCPVTLTSPSGKSGLCQGRVHRCLLQHCCCSRKFRGTVSVDSWENGWENRVDAFLKLPAASSSSPETCSNEDRAENMSLCENKFRNSVLLYHTSVIS